MSIDRAFTAQIREADKWTRLAMQRKNCGDGLAEVMLAARNIGVADGIIRFAPAAARVRLQPKLDELEGRVLLATHELRAKCRI